jgi:tetratricopeptide (TPR) repeat protein
MKRLILILSMLLWVAGTAAAQDATPIPTSTPDPCPPPLAENAAAYYIGLGDARFVLNDFTRAIEIYTCAINQQPDYAPLYVSRGYAYAALLDDERAAADYEYALTLDEALTDAYVNRGILYIRQGNFGLALGDFDIAIALNPDDAVALHNRGVVHAAEKNYDLAIDDFEAALALDPNYTAPYASLAAVYSAMAAENYQRFIDVGGKRLPAGTPTEVLMALDEALRTGDFGVWLSLLSPVRGERP